MVKTFSKKRTRTVTTPFDFEVQRGGEYEKIRFNATKAVDMAAVAHIAAGNASSVAGMLRVIMKALDDTDGTPLTWQPKTIHIAPDPHNGGRWSTTDQILNSRKDTVVDPFADRLEERDTDAQGSDDNGVLIDQLGFRAPGGMYYPLDEAARFLDPAQGSSRRRWVHMIDEDDDVTIEAEDITNLFEWIVSLAAGRPTPPSS